jgi:carboxymethylenebutenolidase
MQEDLLSMLPKTHFSRTEFVVTTLGAMPMPPRLPIKPNWETGGVECHHMPPPVADAKGLEAGQVRIPVKDGEAPAYRAMPCQGRPVPGRRCGGDLRRRQLLWQR